MADPGPRSLMGPLLIPAAFLAAGCDAEQSALDPRSDPARQIETLWWWMLVIASIVFLGAVLLLFLAWVRREKEGFPLLGRNRRLATGLVVVFGIVIPLSVNVGVFVVANFVVAEATDTPKPEETSMDLEVVANQWWWEVRYPGTGAVTANEIHIPVDTKVNLRLRTDDVIHSFWVPQLNRKVDAVPGHENRLLLVADEEGRYRGQCAEFCGPQHSKMGIYVFAEPSEEFERWREHMAADAPAPAGEQEQRGLEVFLDNCASCHTIRGTDATGDVGPDLTHLQSRETLAALAIPNRKGYLAGWILDPQHVKPGARMPGINLQSSEFEDLLAYLETLE